MKSGIKTTEFWITFLTTVGAAAASFESVLDTKYAAIVAMASSIAYALSRGLAKSSGR